MSRTPSEKSPTSFPGWVALASLAVALWLFFANAVPASRERTDLRALAAQFETLRVEYDAAIAESRLARGANARQDLQGLLVAIDRLGFTPAELCAAYPERPPAPVAGDDLPEPAQEAPPYADGPARTDTAAPRTKFQ